MKRVHDGVSLAGEYGPFLAVLQAEAVAATTAYVLVDLSDTTNFKHKFDNALILKSLALHTEKASDGVYDVWVGVITEVDGTNGTAEWIHCFHLEASGNPTDSTDRFAQKIEFKDLDLKVNAATAGSEYLEFVTSNINLAGNTAFQNDVGLASPAGAAGGDTGKPGAGDLVVYVEEVSGSGTIDFLISAEYDAR